VEIPDSLPLIISDSEALEQIVLNLLINAVHACDKEDSWIRLEVKQGHPSKDTCVIEVSDNGCGIEEGVKERIFDPFFTTKTSAQGTGLGLYICHSLAHSLGGTIEVDSTAGHGAAFRIILPQPAES
jgi:signal transduction histidine kinase